MDVWKITTHTSEEVIIEAARVERTRNGHTTTATFFDEDDNEVAEFVAPISMYKFKEI
jgi:hypothetical protein